VSGLTYSEAPTMPPQPRHPRLVVLLEANRARLRLSLGRDRAARVAAFERDCAGISTEALRGGVLAELIELARYVREREGWQWAADICVKLGDDRRRPR
jgi:hypothetical protein